MTNFLKQLLHKYGLLYISIVQLEKERPGAPHQSLHEYYESLGEAEPEEPVLVVRISKDGETRFLHDVDRTTFGQRYERGKITIMELPEDEYYFFEAWRPGMFDLQKQLPPFILQMALVYGYEVFEAYIGQLIRVRLAANPHLLRKDKQILKESIPESQIESLVERELDRIMREPIRGILDKLRNQLSFHRLTADFDLAITKLSLIRNCLVHNSGMVDRKLATFEQSFSLNQPIEVTSNLIQKAIHELRKAALAIDMSFEHPASPD
jgi:hypothetical protein